MYFYPPLFIGGFGVFCRRPPGGGAGGLDPTNLSKILGRGLIFYSLNAKGRASRIRTKPLLRSGRACPLCPGISDINLFRYCQSIIHFDPEISDRAFDLGVAEQS